MYKITCSILQGSTSRGRTPQYVDTVLCTMYKRGYTCFIQLRCMSSLNTKQKNRILIIGLIAVVLVSLSFGFHKYIIQKDFFVYLYAPCDPAAQSCFEFEGEQYLKMYQKAYVIEQCMDGSCDMYACEDGQNTCLVVECSEDELEEGEVCINNIEI